VTAGVEKRKSERIPFESPVVLEDDRSGFQYPATMLNHSAGGIYVASEYAVRPGRNLRISAATSPQGFTLSHSLVKVRWRERLTNGNPNQVYGMGLQYC